VTPTFTDTATYTWSPTETPTVTWSFTRTPTLTHTHTWTLTPTYTGTEVFTATPTFTGTATYTFTPTETGTGTAVPTATFPATPVPGDCDGVRISAPYPNPVSAAPVKVDVLSGCTKTVTWKVYTTNYRLVAWGSTLVTGKRTVAWDLRDFKGRPVADGYYHWKFESDGGFVIRKVMVLR
jgi:hypothetical protein